MKEDKTIIQNVINQLKAQGFSKTIDTISEYSKDADLYFIKIDSKKFIVINHYCKNQRTELQGFDCWMSNYNSESEIGNKKAIKVENLRLGFQLDRDWYLIAEHLKRG